MDWKNLGKRAGVAVVAAPLILWAAWKGGVAFFAFIEIITILGLLEFYRLAQAKGMQPNQPLGVIAGLVLGAQIYFRGNQEIWLTETFLLVLLVLTELFRNRGSALHNTGATLLGFVYVAGLWSFMLLLRELPRQLNIDYASAGTWMVMLLVTIWVCDTAAYFCGLAFGRHKLFERVSPKKTWEGALGGLIFAILMAVAAQYWFVRDLRLLDGLVIGFIIGTVGQMSDLVESLFKRDAGVKDSSGLIPGHGGILDRFDSEMLVAPVVYLYLLLALPH